ncbi:hypothetical protein GCM10009736_33440 [Actinomadura bangladeshensis]
MQPLHAGGQDAFLVVDGDDHLDQPAPSPAARGRRRRGGRAPFGDEVIHATEVRRGPWEAGEAPINAA